MTVTGKTRNQVDAEKEAAEALAEIARLLNALQTTDWYVTRLTETGVPVPEPILSERQAARQRISDLRIKTEGATPWH